MQRRKFLKNSVLAVPVLHEALRRPLAFSLGTSDRAPLEVTASSQVAGKKLIHYWSNCVAAGRANEGLRANWQEQLKLCVNECGFRYLRLHGLFHDDMFVYREVDAKPLYTWRYIDDLFDRMLDIGIRPFVELTFFPKEIAHDDGTFAWWKGHGTPPADFTRWAEIIANFVRHCQARYGNDEVRQWYFEIWNEPNLQGFWNGTQQHFFEMYRAVVRTIKNVDPGLRVGGPATSSYHPEEVVYQRLAAKTNITADDFVGIEFKAPWVVDFLGFCEKENLPLDFVSSHPYPTTYPIDSAGNHLEVSRPVTSTHEDMLWLKRAMSKTRYAKVEIHLTEWSSSPSFSDYTRDSLQEAAYIVKVNLDCVGLVQSLAYWTFTDIVEEAGAGDSTFLRRVWFNQFSKYR